MKPRVEYVILVAILMVYVLQSGAALGSSMVPLSIGDALSQAVQSNKRYALDLRSIEIRRAEVQARAGAVQDLTITTRPLQINDGKLQNPFGMAEVRLPLSDELTVSGSLTLTLDLDDQILDPEGRLSLDYTLLGSAKKIESISEVDDFLRRENDLVLEVFAAFRQLYETDRKLHLEQARLDYLKDALAASEIKTGREDLTLRRQVGTLQREIETLMIQRNQANRNLSYILGREQPVDYEPQVDILSYRCTIEADELFRLAFAADPELKKAHAALHQAEAELHEEKRSKGWDVKLSGGLEWRTRPDGSSGWSIGLIASRELTSGEARLARLELAVEQAELALAERRRAVQEQVLQYLQVVIALDGRLLTLTEQIEEAAAALELASKKLTAGLVSALDVEKAELDLRGFESEREQVQLEYIGTVLAVYDLCGIRLMDEIASIIR
ncbi:MAG: TolC family protein [Firmicutes bacterium]|nr:TolC family protein [Bacillota bacterium]